MGFGNVPGQGSAQSPNQIRDALQTLIGVNRLDASAVKNLISGTSKIVVTSTLSNPFTGDSITDSPFGLSVSLTALASPTFFILQSKITYSGLRLRIAVYVDGVYASLKGDTPGVANSTSILPTIIQIDSNVNPQIVEIRYNVADTTGNRTINTGTMSITEI
jgi:hypothetical protein